MSPKKEVKSNILLLLRLAEERNTEQARLVCTKLLEQLDKTESDSETLKILRDINHTYIGIEAHGHLPQAKYGANQ